MLKIGKFKNKPHIVKNTLQAKQNSTLSYFYCSVSGVKILANIFPIFKIISKHILQWHVTNIKNC